jgi:hypothetical protein
MGLNTKHEQVGGSADASKHTKTQAGGRVLIKQNTAAATATANPEQSSGSGSEAAVYRASCMGRGRGRRRGPKAPCSQ